MFCSGCPKAKSEALSDTHQILPNHPHSFLPACPQGPWGPISIPAILLPAHPHPARLVQKPPDPSQTLSPSPPFWPPGPHFHSSCLPLFRRAKFCQTLTRPFPTLPPYFLPHWPNFIILNLYQPSPHPPPSTCGFKSMHCAHMHELSQN